MFVAILRKERGVEDNEIKELMPAKSIITHDFGRFVIAVTEHRDTYTYEDDNLFFHIEGIVYNLNEEELIKNIKEFCRGKARNLSIIRKFNGSFSIIIFEKIDNRLSAISDRLGLKDIFYCKTSGGDFLFASRIRPLLASSSIHVSIDKTSLAHYLCYQFVPKPSTMFKGIKKIPNSTVLSFKEDRVTASNYWDFRFEGAGITEQDYAANLRNCIINSVKLRIPKTENIGLLLSGGLDSTIVAAILKNETQNNKIVSFTGGFKGYQDYKSFDYGKKVADIIGIDNKAILIEENVVERLPEIYTFLDEPMADSAIMQSYILLTSAKKRADYVFSGEFSDVIFGGMENYIKSRIEREFWQNLPENEKNLAKLNPGSPLVEDFINKSSKKSQFMHYKFGETFFNQEDLSKISSDEYNDRVTKIDLSRPVKIIYDKCKETDIFNKEMYTDIKLAAQRRLFHLTEPAKMNDIELVLPFTDNNVIDYSLKIPSNLKIYGRIQKYILKKAFTDYIPQFVIKREKEGFTPPFHLWYDKSYKWVMDYISSSEMNFLDNFKLKNYAKTIIDSRTRVYDKNMAVWIILNLVAWYKSLLATPEILTIKNY